MAVYQLRWLLLFGSVLFGARAFEHHLTLDNVHYAALSKALLFRDNPLLLGFADTLYLNKPPFFFWCNAIVMKVLGFTNFSAMLLSLTCGVTAMALTARLALRIVPDRNVALLSGFTFAANYIVIKHTQGCRMESLLLVLLLAALLAFLRYLDTRQRRFLFLWAICSGLAVLTKGPLGLAPLGAGLAWFFLHRTEGVHPTAKEWLCVAVLFFGTFAWWYGYAITHSNFSEVFFGRELFGRIAGDDGETKPDAIYTYLVMLGKYYFYYLPFLAYGLATSWRAWRMQKAGQLLGLYAAGLLIVMHLPAVKYARYLYPLLPVASILTAQGLLRLFPINVERFLKAGALSLSAVFLFWPFSLHGADFAPLTTLNQMSRASGAPIVVDPTFYAHWEKRSAVYYYCDQYEVADAAAAPTPPHRFFVTERRDLPQGVLLFRTRKVSIYFLHD
jgi:4-amino-4-deoxy-L-arabinose transferase-like glycosyltransferase